MTTNLSSTTSLFDRMQVGVMLLVAVFFAGCVHTPANRAAVDNNILTKPIHIELPIGGTNPSAKKFDEYFDIVTYDRSYLIDDISRKKVREIAEGLYPEYCKVRDEILTEAGKQNNMVKIREALTNTFTKNDLSYARQMGFGNSINTVFSESEITLNKETQGRTDCHILLYGDNFKTKSTPSVDINIDLNYNVLEDRIIVDVTGIRYNSNRLNVRSEILVKAIEDTTPPTAITPNKYYFAGKINDQLKVRYSSKHANTSKTVRTYKVDLATAKARIQRAFGNSYDHRAFSFCLPCVASGRTAARHRHRRCIEDRHLGRFGRQPRKGLGKHARGRHLEVIPERGLARPLLHEHEPQRILGVVVHRVCDAPRLGARARHVFLAQCQRFGERALAGDHTAMHQNHRGAPVAISAARRVRLSAGHNSLAL